MKVLNVAVMAMLVMLLQGTTLAANYRSPADSSSVEYEQSSEHHLSNRRNNAVGRNDQPQDEGSQVYQPSYTQGSQYGGNRRQPPMLASSFGQPLNQQGASSYPDSYNPGAIVDIHRQVFAAVGNKVRHASSVVHNIPYILTSITSGVLIPQVPSGSQYDPNTYGQSDMHPSVNGVVYPPHPGSNQESNSNNRQSSTGIQSSNPGVNQFPVVIVNGHHNQANPVPQGNKPTGSSGSSQSIPVAAGGARPPTGHVPDEQPFVIDIDSIPGLPSTNTQQSQNSFGNGATTNNFPSQGYPIIGGSNKNPSNGATNLGDSTNNARPTQQNSNNFGPPNNFAPPPIANNFGGSYNVPSNSGIFSVVNGIREFTLDLLSKLGGVSNGGNIIFSPISVTSLLSLLTIATNGLSRHEIEMALSLPNSDSSSNQHEQYEDILRRLNHNSQGINITTSSRLFLEQSTSIYGAFTSKAADHYNCTVSLENFRNRPAQTMKRVNRWVARETKGKITEFITSPFSRETLFVAANTIYFSGEWETPFPEYFTGPRDFDTGRETIRIPMMTNVFTTPHYYSSYINADILSLPYKGGEFAMIVILPRESPQEKSIELLENQLDTFLIDELIRNLTSKTVSVSLPKMRLAMKSNLGNSLSEMNIQSIFSPITADFSGLTNRRPIWVGSFLHEAVMEVSEIGTVAAAVSGVSLDRIGGYQRVNINKPAIIFIADLVNNLPLFWTRMVKPEPLS